MPFGEELVAGYGNRTSDLGYTANQVRTGFAGKDKDEETGFNYFGERYYSSATGRFTSPDILMASGGAYNPQTWNRYAYVVNNPVAYIDVNGELRRDKNGKIVETNQIVKGPSTHVTGVTSFGSFVTIQTDKGRDVVAFKNNPNSAIYDYRQNFNCHGLTFTQGQYNIGNKDVDAIIEDEYRPLTSGEKPQVGDVVIYYDAANEYASGNGVVHSATVVETDGTIDGTRAAGLGGVEIQSRTTTLNQQFGNNDNYVIFRKKKENKNEPTPEQRAETARNAVKTPPLTPATTGTQPLGAEIIPRKLIPLPEPPAIVKPQG
jgi:RHS repeat-associated protein